MNARRIALILGLVLLVFTIPVAGEPEADIVVNGADAIITPTVSSDQGLLDAAAIPAPRVVVEYANHLRHLDLIPVSSPLQTVLSEVSERVVVQYSNAIVRKDLATVPAAFQTVLGQVLDRIVFQYANANLAYSLSYPQELVNDDTPPVVSEVNVGPIEAGGTVTITWTTDEFANSTVLYGTVSGANPYPFTVTDPLHVKLHEVGLPGLVPGTIYYYKVQSTDLSGNTTTTAEYSFTVQENWWVYLPLVVRN